MTVIAELSDYRAARPFLGLVRELRLRVPGSRLDSMTGELYLSCPLCNGTASVLATARAEGDAIECNGGCDPARVEAALRHVAGVLPQACPDPSRHRSASHRAECPRCIAWSAAARDAYRQVQNVASLGLAPLADSGWTDLDLDDILGALEDGVLDLPTPTVGMIAGTDVGLLYEGRVSGVAGESGSGKGWLALAIGVEQMQLGRHLYYLDWEDSAALSLLRLVGVLGVDAQLVRDRFHYLHPSRHDPEGIRGLVERVALTPSALVVVDSTGESIAAAGFSQNADEDVARWMQSLAHPLSHEAGATVLLLDHMTKSEDGGLWPIGSQRKRAAITGAQYVAEVVEPFSKSRNGAVALRVAKDRHGAREARSVASFVQFTHPLAQASATADGELVAEPSERLAVTLGLGKSAEDVRADRDANAALQVALDVERLTQLDPPPTSYRDVKVRLRWQDKRAQAAMKAWREGSGS